MEFKSLHDVTNCLVNLNNNSTSLQILCGDRFLLHSIIIQHLPELLPNEFWAKIESDLCCPRVSGKPFLFGDVCDRSDGSFDLMDFKPASCWIHHSDTFAYEICLSFSANGIWANEINAHFIPRYCFCFLLWEVSKFFGRSALVYLTSRADNHQVCDLISHFGPPKVLTNGFFGSIDTGMSKVIMIPLDDSWL